jgi:hypothetical protein
MSKPKIAPLSLVVVGLVRTALPSSAAAYTWEVSGARQHGTLGETADVDVATIEATHFFGNLAPQGPLALGPFLFRASRVTVNVAREQQEQTVTPAVIGTAPPPIVAPILHLGERRDNFSVAGRYVGARSGWFAGGSYVAGDAEPSGASLAGNSVDSEGFGILVGKYFGEDLRTSLSLRFDTSDRNEAYEPTTLCTFIQCVSSTTVTFDNLGVSALAIAVSPIVDPDTTPRSRFYTYSLGGRLFPTNRLSVHVGYVRWDGDPLRDVGYDVGTTMFFRPAFALSFTYSHTHRASSPISVHTDTAQLRLIGRF